MKSNGFLSLENALIHSDLVKALSCRAKALILDLASRYNGTNNGEITYGLRDAMAWLHCGKNTAINTLKELKTAGLIQETVKASFDHKNGARKGTASRWHLNFLREK